jgi:PAS domain S-box-containing protein
LTDITDRKLAESALKKSEHQFRTLVNVLPQFVAYMDKNLNYKFVNQTYIDNFGIPKEKIVGKALADVIGKTAFEKARPHIKKVLNGEIVRYQERYEYSIGEPRHIEGVLIPNISRKNEISGYYAVLSDISLYIKIQNDLRDSKSKFKGIIDNLPATPFRFVLDRTGGIHFDYISYKCREIIGISDAEIRNDANKFFDQIPSPDHDRVMTAVSESAKSLKPYDIEHSFVKPNGELIWLHTTSIPQRLENGDIIWDGLGMDISDRVSANQALEKSHKDLRLRETIAELFLTSIEDEVFNYILSELLSFFDCEYGYLGYISNDGDLVCPSMSREIWSKCRIPGKQNVFPAEVWGGIWGESLKQKRSIFSNANLTLPEGHIGLNNALAVPLMSDKILVGQIVLANKSDDLTVDDQKNLESIATFMAPILQMYLEKETAQKELKSKINKLKEINIALNILLENRDEDKKKTIDTILNNHEKLISPYIERLKIADSKEDAWTIAGIIETNLQESLRPFEKSFSSAYRKFTPMEVQVADLIKAGKTSKDMAKVLNLSLRTVGFHRDNIRKKLDINKAKVNLRTFLQSLE